LDEGFEDEEAFQPVAAVSKFNDRLYLTLVSPWLRMLITEDTAELIRQLHPLRTQRYMLSDRNPLLWPVETMANWVRDHRQPVDGDNPFLKWEKLCSDAIQSSLNAYRDSRDRFQEYLFKLLYDNAWMKNLFPEDERAATDKTPEMDPQQKENQKKLWLEAMQKGGFQEAVVRIILVVAMVNQSYDRQEYAAARRIIQTNDRLKHIGPAELKRLFKEQAGIVAYNQEEAIRTLTKLLPKKADRSEAFEIANSIATADMELDQKEQDLLAEIQRIFKL
jgi:tellurite resistance protein